MDEAGIWVFKAGQTVTSISLLQNLLNMIHEDAGHHTSEVGLEKSVEDAMEEVFRLRSLFGSQ